MQPPKQEPVQAIVKLAGERAGLSVEDMIQTLDAGVTVETLLDLIECSLRASTQETGRSLTGFAS